MNIQQVLEEHSIEYLDGGGHHHARDGWLQMDCPFCSHSGHGSFHMGYRKDRGWFSCWRCGRLQTTQVLMELLSIPETEARKIRVGLMGSTGDYIGKLQRRRVRGKLKLPKHLGPLERQHRHYLERRGFDPKEIKRLWKIQGLGIDGRDLRWRIFIPIDLEGETISWTTRSIGKTSLRYISAGLDQEILPHKETIYGVDYVGNTIIVVEGPTDVWNVGPGAGGTFGLSYTEYQLCVIAMFPVRVVCYDNSSEAQAAASRMCQQLSCLPGETYRVKLNSKDPGSADRKTIRSLRREFLE